MHFYPLKVSRLTRSLLGHIVWKMDPGERIIYLTFDDGPVPEATPWVLRCLEEFGAKATFFCVGHNIDKHPRIFDRILRAGHTPANHTYNHLSGFKCSLEEYMENVWKAERLTGTRLFRPPYARITPEQYSTLRKTFRIVLGDVIAGDFDPSQDVEYLRQNLLSNLEDGSIAIFHDSIKSIPRTSELLPAALRYFSELGYRFHALPSGDSFEHTENKSSTDLILKNA